jgi:hypothetical protein
VQGFNLDDALQAGVVSVILRVQRPNRPEQPCVVQDIGKDRISVRIGYRLGYNGEKLQNRISVRPHDRMSVKI